MKRVPVVILIAVVTMLSALEIYVQSDSFAARTRPYVVKPLREILGPDVKIGFVRANLIPPFLEARNLSLPDDRGKEAAAIRKIKIYINPLPLVFKKIRLPSIAILEPRIYAERAADGSLNFFPLVDRIRENMARAGGSSSGYTLLLKSISVQNGQIRYKDDTLATKVSLTSLNTVIRINRSTGSMNAHIRNSRLQVALKGYPEIEGTFKTSLAYQEGIVRLGNTEFSTGDAVLSIAGTVAAALQPEFDLTARFRSGPETIGKVADFLRPSPREKGTHFEAAAVIRGKASEIRINGDVRYGALAFRGVILKEGAFSFAYHDREISLNSRQMSLEKSGTILIIDRASAVAGYRNGVFEIRQAEISADDLNLDFYGSVDPSEGYNIRWTIHSAQTGRLLSSLARISVEGPVTLEGRLTGPVRLPVLEGHIEAGTVLVRKVRFDKVSGDVDYRDGLITLSTQILRQSSHYLLTGSLNFSGREVVYAARLKVSRSDVVSVVQLFYKTLPLQLSATGELSFQGTLSNYTGSGYLTLEEGAAYGEHFSRGAVTVTLSKGRISFPQVTLYKKRGMVKATGWIDFGGTYSASLEARDILLSSIDVFPVKELDGEMALDVRSSGSFTTPEVAASLDINQLSYRTTHMGPLHADGELKGDSINVTTHLTENDSRLRFHWLIRRPYSWTVEAAIHSSGLNPVLFFGGRDISEKMKVVADGRISARGKGLDLASLSADAIFERISMTVGEYRIDNEGASAFTLKGDKLTISSLSFAGPGTRISATGSAALFRDVDVTMTGTMNLPLLRLFFPAVEHAAGTAELKATVHDGWKSPSVDGEMRLRDGEIKIRDIPQKFSAMNGDIHFSKGRILSESISAAMGGGTLDVSGWVQLSGMTLQDFSIKTTVENVTVRYPEGLNSTMTGNLYYDGDRKEQILSGDIKILKAKYDKPIEWKTMLVDVGRGLYQKKKTDIGWIGETQINVRFHGSDNIIFQNNLAKMPLEIDVFLRGTVNHPQLLGRIEAQEGTVYFRKNDFTILHVSVDFVDPNRMNPVLDIQAETQVHEYDIRLSVTGTAEHAVVTFISDPSLSDTDILSLLALGKKSSELTGKESNIGVGEAASFATGQFQDIFENRARSLTGFDRFQVDPYVNENNASVPRVTVGKEIVQNRLYVTYSSNVGTAVPEQIFSIEYVLNKHFSLVGEQDETGNTGADIKYRFEFH